MNKKAQAAVETLMIYGVTIFIVMLAIGALIGFGVIDLGKLLPDKCDIPNGLSCEVAVVTPTGVQMQLKNNVGKNIQAFNISITGEGDNMGVWQCDGTEYDTLLANGVVSDIVTIPCNVQIPSGKKITGVISINYTPVGLQISQPVSGVIRATVS